MARLILTQPGEDVDVGGDVSVFGTAAGGEVITVVRGTIVLDPSFNIGGDTVRLPDDAAFFTARLVGGTVILEGLGVSVTIPVGTAGMEVSFNDTTRILRFDPATSTVTLGSQIITATQTNVVPFGGAATLVGTEFADTINGTDGDDVIDALGGADIVNGGAGNDVIRGGSGGDDLDGSLGNDQIFGGPGADRLYDNEGASAYLDGGTGNDSLSVVNLFGTSFTLIGGDGDDYIEIGTGRIGTVTINAGSGEDRVVVVSQGMPFQISLGSERDQLVFAALSSGEDRTGVVTVSDFQAGQFGDTIEYIGALSGYVTNWDQNSNPFSSGHLRLIDRDGSAVLQVDRDGPFSAINGFRDLIIFTGVASTSITRENLEGFDPRPPQQQALAEVSDLVEQQQELAAVSDMVDQQFLSILPGSFESLAFA